jgi:hypothetical protein
MIRQPNPATSGVSRKKPLPRYVSLFDTPNTLCCSPEWHMQDMGSRLTCPIYSWGRRLSKNSDRFYASIGTIAKYFARDRTTVIRAISELVDSGWAKAVNREPGKPVTYRFVSHKDWAKDHPGLCIERDCMPWAGEGDPLGKRLYSLSSGRAVFLPNQMEGLRKFDFSDEEIAFEFEKFLNQNPHRGAEWNRVYFKFYAYLANAADEIADGTITNSDQPLQRDTYQSLQRDTPCGASATPTSRARATQVVGVEFTPGKNRGIGNREIPASPSAHAAAHFDSHPLKTKGAAPPLTPAKNQEHARNGARLVKNSRWEALHAHGD